MKCPYCQNEMENGFIQSGRNILWTEKKHIISTNPKNENDFIIASNPLGGATIKGFCCRKCRKLVIEY